MSLLSLRKPIPAGDRKKKNREDGSLSKRKSTKPRRFEISKTQLNYPTLGGNSSTTASFSLSTSKTPFTSFSTSSSSSASAVPSISLSGSLYSSESKRVEDALASSKLNGPSDTGPLEPTPMLGKREKKRMRNHERSLTKGSAWFNMAKAEITKEKKNDLEALKLRSAMDGVLHYKRNNITHTPKYFHVGTVVETSADFYSSRIPKKQRKKTLAQEFAADYEKGRSRFF